MLKISSEVKIGILVIVTIAIFIWGFNFLKGNNILKISRGYYAVYNDIQGIMEAAPIYLNGYKVGLIDEIYLPPDNPDEIVLSLSMKEKIQIPEDSKVFIIDDGLLGSKAIKLKLGNAQKYYDFGDTIKSDIEKGIFDEVKSQVSVITSSVDSVIQIAENVLNKEMQQKIRESIENLASTTETIADNNEKIDRIFSDILTLTASIRDKEEQIDRVINNFAALSDSIATANIKTTISNANTAVEKLNGTLASINEGAGTVGMLVNDKELYQNLVNASYSLDSLLVDLKENPRRYVHFSVFGRGGD